MYSLSQDNWPFRKKMLNEPSALEVLAKVVANEPGSKADAAKLKGQSKVKKDNEGDYSQLLRLLAIGMSHHHHQLGPR